LNKFNCSFWRRSSFKEGGNLMEGGRDREGGREGRRKRGWCGGASGGGLKIRCWIIGSRTKIICICF
jgi:hypothetical protein